MQPKHIHFIGICGVAMGGLAMAMKRAGWKVTGSDVGIYPPISTYLKEQGVEYYTGWHPEKIGTPDLVVVGNVAGSENLEWQYVQEKKIPHASYPELIARYFVKPNSIVCAGTYGKTTTAALLSLILTQAGLEPSYMFGGLAVNDFPSALCHCEERGTLRSALCKLCDAAIQNDGDRLLRRRSAPPRNDGDDWSVLEGDEYKTARWDNSPKFSHYSPTHLLLTAIEWDHADVYPTEASYFEAFEKLIKSVPESGVIVASERIPGNMEHVTHIIRYGKDKKNDYIYNNVLQTKDGLQFNILVRDVCYVIRAKLIGDYMADNLCAAFAMAREVGIEPEVIIKAIESFKGIKRRLEKRFEGDVTVIDDIAHSPAKAKSTLETLSVIARRSTIPRLHSGQTPQSKSPDKKIATSADANRLPRNDGRIVSIFEPNAGNRQIESIPSYDNQFTAADEVIIPRLTQIKHDPAKPEPMDGTKLAEVIGKTHPNVKYIDDDEKLVDYLVKNTHKGDVVVFLGSHGFRGMIDELVSRVGKVGRVSNK